MSQLNSKQLKSKSQSQFQSPKMSIHLTFFLSPFYSILNYENHNFHAHVPNKTNTIHLIFHILNTVGNNLRPVEVDGELFTAFMNNSEYNTIRGIETCGILCGKLVTLLFF
jgi:hypothetical protein